MKAIKLLLFMVTIFWLAGCEKSDIELKRTDTLKGKYITQTELVPTPMNVYLGNLHSHTKYSDGNGTPADAFAWARDVAKFDFYAITDHAELFTSKQWDDTGVQASLFTQNNSFVAIRGFEWTSLQGHINVFNTPGYASADVQTTIDDIYHWVNLNHGYCQLNHPGWANETLNHLKFSAEVANNCLAIETGNDTDGNFGNLYLPYYTQALDNGWKVAPVNNQDNHSFDDSHYRTAILAPSLSTQNVLEAMAARRVYSTDDDSIKVRFSYQDQWMGSSTNAFGKVSLNIQITDDKPITRIEVVTRHGATVFAQNNDLATYEANPQVMISGKTYFFLKITSADTLFTVTAPIWFN